MAPAVIISEALPTKDASKQRSSPHKLTCGGRMRYNIILNALIVGLVASPFFIPTIATLAINSYFAFLWVCFLILATITQCKIRSTLQHYNKLQIKTPTPEAEGDHVTVLDESKSLKKIMVTFAYKEPLELIVETLENVSKLSQASSVILGISLEQRTPEKDKKIAEISRRFENCFAQLIITVHPYGTEGEIPGKCSNFNYALRSIVSHIRAKDPKFDPKDYIVTNFDIDSRFHPRFLEIQQDTCLQEKDPYSTVWQPVLFYNWNLDKLSFITRMTGLNRNILMMGALIPFNINVMSVYTASLQLFIQGNYTHPAYQMEDIICYIRWMLMTKRVLKIKPIYCPTISAPTSGNSVIQETVEWAKQLRRWTIGSAEVFHYFCIKARRINFFYAITWGLNYVNYYGFFMIAQGLLTVTTTIYLFVIERHSPDSLQIWFTIPLGVVYFSLLMVIIINKIAVKTFLKQVEVDEKIPIWKDFFLWIVSPFIFIAYNIVALVGLFEAVFHGKKVCTHDASKKDALVNVV